MQGYEIFLVVGVIVLLFGGSQLPKLARSLGQAKREFEGGQSETTDDKKKTSAEDDELKAAERRVAELKAKAARADAEPDDKA
jgi:sec-independent protein translocase protein TatA